MGIKTANTVITKSHERRHSWLGITYNEETARRSPRFMLDFLSR
jgi:hypothetical protein